MDAEELGRAAKVRRLELGLTQFELVMRAKDRLGGGLSEPTVRNVEAGKTTASDRTLVTMATALDWPADHLVNMRGGDPDRDPPAEGALARPDESEVTGIAAKAGRLSPEKRDRLIGYLDALLDEPEDE